MNPAEKKNRGVEEIENKRQELFRVLLQIQNKITALDEKGLSAKIFDGDAIKRHLAEITQACKEESAKLETSLVTSNDQNTKDQNLRTGFEKYMKDEKKKLEGYKANVNTYGTSSKKYISEISVRKLKSLVNKKNVNELFRFLFVLLYKKKAEEFDTKQFTNLALGSDADDFQIKLASFNTAIFHDNTELAEQFKRLKDQEFPEAETNPDLNGLLNWMDYIYEMYLAEVEYKQQKKNLETNQAEFAERLLKISQNEQDNQRKRQAIQIYKKAIEHAETHRQLADKKSSIAGKYGGNFNVDKREFQERLTTFRKELFDLPNHL